jgi:Spy/CpxP family protein refolding chaperone
MSATKQTPNLEQGRRRRFFKRAAIATLIGGIAVGIGIKAFAYGGGPGGWHRGGFMAGPLDAAQVDEHLDRMLKHLYVEIDATDEQKQKLAPIVKQAVKDLLPLHEKMRDARKKALELLTQDGIDRAAIETLRVEHLQLAEQASRRVTQALADAAEVLTAAQRKELATRIERHRGGWHHG